MKIKKNMLIILVSALLISNLILVGCEIDTNNGDSNDKSVIEVDNTKNKKSNNKKEKNIDSTQNKALNKIDEVAKKSKSTKELYVVDKVKVGEKGDVKPGIYDLKILGGSGNVMGSRKDIFVGMDLNWAVSAKKSDSINPSVIRVILFEGDTVDFLDISKVKFTAVAKPKKMKNKIGIGQYVVGRDIKAGTYKLATNTKMDKEFDNLGWDIDIYNFDKDDERSQSFNPGNSDVVVKLEDGEVITTSFDLIDDDCNPDSLKLIFVPLKQ